VEELRLVSVKVIVPKVVDVSASRLETIAPQNAMVEEAEMRNVQIASLRPQMCPTTHILLLRSLTLWMWSYVSLHLTHGRDRVLVKRSAVKRRLRRLMLTSTAVAMATIVAHHQIQRRRYNLQSADERSALWRRRR